MIIFTGHTQFTNQIVIEYKNHNVTSPLWDTSLLSPSEVRIYRASSTLAYGESLAAYADLGTGLTTVSGDILAVFTIEGISITGFSSITDLYRVINIGTNFNTIDSACFSGCTALTEVDLGENINTISSDAFLGCLNLSKIYYYGNSMNIIASGAFTGCGFSTINIPASVTTIATGAFSKCTNLDSIYIPNTVTTIATKAFSECSNLRIVHIGSGTSTIGENAFYKCNNIEEIDIDADNSYYADYDMTAICRKNYTSSYGAIIYGNSNTDMSAAPSTLAVIGPHAFQDCETLSSIALFNTGITLIGEGAFSGCKNLVSLTLPNNLSQIDKEAFSGCTSLVGSSNTLTFFGEASGITIGDKAFYGCSALTSLTFTVNITRLGTNVFGNCSAINTITTDSSHNQATNSYFIYQNMILKTSNGAAPFTLTVGCYGSNLNLNAITAIGDNAFYGNTRIPGLTLSSTNVSSIGENAFYGCTALANVSTSSLSSRVEIKKGAFYSCTNLVDLTLTGVITIRSSAFAGCTSLVLLNIPNTCTLIEDGAFTGCTGMKNIYVASSNSVYAEANTTNKLNSIINKTSKKILLTTLNSAVIDSADTTDYSATVTGIGSNAGAKMKDGTLTTNTFVIKSYINTVEEGAYDGAELKTKLQIEANTSGTGDTYTAGANLLTNGQYWQPSYSPRYGGVNTWAYSLNIFSRIDYSHLMGYTSTLNPRITSQNDNTNHKVQIVEQLDTETTSENRVIAEYYYVANGSGYDIYKKMIGTVNGHYYDDDGVSHYETLPTADQVETKIYTYPNYIYVDATNTRSIFFELSDLIGDCPADMYIRSATSGNYNIEVGKNAFADNTTLAQVNLLRPLSNPGEGIFSNDTHLATFTIGLYNSQNVADTGFGDYIPAQTFMGDTAFTGFTANTGFNSNFSDTNFPRNIGKSAFEKCNISASGWNPFGKFVSTFGNRSFFDAFSGSVSLTFCNLQNLGENTFGNVDITTVGLSASAPSAYMIFNNGLFIAEDKSLVLCARNTTYSGGPHSVGSYAAYGRTLTNAVDLDTNYESIGVSAFEGAIFSNGRLSYTDGGSYSLALTIDKKAFAKSNLSSISLTNSQTRTFVNESAFSGCTSLTSVTASHFSTLGDEAFSGCTGLQTITCTVDVSAGDYVFDKCTNLTSITYSGTTVGKGFLANCTRLSSIIVPVGNQLVTSSGVDSSALHAIYGTDGVLYAGCASTKFPATYLDTYSAETITFTEVGPSAFEGSSIETVSLPNTVIIIDEDAFLNCTALTNLYLSDNIQTIGNNAFKGCTSLDFVRIPNSCTTIGTNAFAGCTNLIMVNLDTNDAANNIDTIEEGAFSGCTHLTSAIMPNYGSMLPANCYNQCSGITNLDIPDNITNIGDNAFYGCTGITSITISGEVDTIGAGAFYGCTSVSTVYVKSKIKDCSIGKNAFNSIGSSVSKNVKFVYGPSKDNPIVEALVSQGFEYIELK